MDQVTINAGQGGMGSTMHGAISWRSIIAGLLVSLLACMILMALGVALGGVTMTSDTTPGNALQRSGTFGGFWTLLSVFLALLAGGYFTARISVFYSRWICMSEGVVIAALFMGVMLWQVAGLTGWIARTGGSIIGGISSAAGQAVSGVDVNIGLGINEMVEDAFAGVEFIGDPRTVISGTAARLLRGNVEAASAYLARNSSLTTVEINNRLAQINATLAESANQARLAAGQAMKVSGWSAFGILVLGLLGAVLGGWGGSKANQKTPISDSEMARARVRSAYAQ